MFARSTGDTNPAYLDPENAQAAAVNQVWPGDSLISTATVAAIRDHDGGQLADLSIVTVNGDSMPVLTGTATVRLDP